MQKSKKKKRKRILVFLKDSMVGILTRKYFNCISFLSLFEIHYKLQRKNVQRMPYHKCWTCIFIFEHLMESNQLMSNTKHTFSKRNETKQNGNNREKNFKMVKKKYTEYQCQGSLSGWDTWEYVNVTSCKLEYEFFQSFSFVSVTLLSVRISSIVMSNVNERPSTKNKNTTHLLTLAADERPNHMMWYRMCTLQSPKHDKKHLFSVTNTKKNSNEESEKKTNFSRTNPEQQGHPSLLNLQWW